LYFTFWDRVMGTLRNDYETRFEEVVAKKSWNCSLTFADGFLW
jgi:sterol desaturase/sphingolipid hydroxylase (fatty acid hydroxylase superfamily)